MPFVKERFNIANKTPAFLFIMRTLSFTQGQAQRVLAKGRLLINGNSIFNTGESVEGEVEIVYFKPSSKGKKPIFQNKNFMVFEKNSGELVHPNTMATPYSILDEIRAIAGDNANAVHRIDMETSGLLLASKNKPSESYLKGLFEKRAIQKSYLAWVDGEIIDEFVSDESIKINSDYSKTKHKVYISDDGKQSKTYFKPLCYDKELDATLIECHPHTGRTHQIRIHLYHIKHPILGDPIYGTTFKSANNYLENDITKDERVVEMGASRLMLHAKSLSFNFGSKFFVESKEDFFKMKSLICHKETRTFNNRNVSRETLQI